MQDLPNIVRYYVNKLTGPDADNAWHSLRELGPVALPYLEEAFRSSRDYDERLLLAKVVCHFRSLDALPFLAQLLGDNDPEIWKTALDGLVMLGDDQQAVRTRILEVLDRARMIANSEKRSWIDEAMGQVPPWSPD